MNKALDGKPLVEVNRYAFSRRTLGEFVRVIRQNLAS